MGYVEQYAAIVAELVRLRGELGLDSNGNRVPALTGDDTVGILAVYTRGLIGAIGARSKIVATPFVDAEGIILSAFGPLTITPVPRTAQAYLAAPASPTPWRRMMSPSGNAEQLAANARGGALTFEPARDNTIRNTQAEQIYFLREALDEYEAALQSSVSAFSSYGPGRISKDASSAFLLSVRKLGRSLDVMNENPPTALVADLRGALKASVGATGAALEAGASVAGELAAKVANTAGTIAGNFAGGFLQNAGLLTLIVAGVVVYKVIP